MTISEHGLAIIKLFEGLRLDAYLDSAGIPTIGYGIIRYPDGRKVKMGDKCTLSDAEAWLIYEVEQKTKAVNTLVKSYINQNQFDALSSLTYNIGAGAFGKSTVLKLVNENPAEPAISAAFARWNKSGGKITNGLVKRRAMEASLYFS